MLTLRLIRLECAHLGKLHIQGADIKTWFVKLRQGILPVVYPINFKIIDLKIKF